jgi:Cof subfamily protein (haloacid dehalogenase superfamily)
MMLAKGLDCWIYAGEDWYVRDPHAPHADREARTVAFQATVIQDLYSKLDRAVKIVGISDDLPLVAEVEKELQDAIGRSATAARSQPYYLDVTHKDANKGFVLAYLAKQYDLQPDQIATIGDMPNDVLMFAPSGFSIAMGNASDEVKSKATTTTDTNENDGFAKAVETNFLNV